MSSVPNITRLVRPPRVGALYRVPCVRVRSVWIAVRLPRHRDNGVPQPHVHADMRFFTQEMRDILCTTGTVLPHELDLLRSPRAEVIDVSRGADRKILKWRTLACLRSDAWAAGPLTSSGATAKTRPAVAANGRHYCPHKLADLTDVPWDSRGRARCPLHGQLVQCWGVGA